MTCAERDQDLLMLAHDALPWERRMLTQWHVRGCARCRTKLSTFGTVSRALAWAISGRVPQGASAIPVAHRARPGHSVTSLLVTGLVLIIVAEVTVAIVRHAMGLPTPPSAMMAAPPAAMPASPSPAATFVPRPAQDRCIYARPQPTQSAPKVPNSTFH